jgi:hypothetical protein
MLNMVELMQKRKYNLLKAYFKVMLGHLSESQHVRTSGIVTTQSRLLQFSARYLTKKKLSIT